MASSAKSSAKSSEAIVLAEVPSFRDAIVKRSLKDVIADRIAGLIASGIVQVGDALPSERELASSLNVSRETMRGAIQILAARGILEISHGARTRVVRADVGPVTIGVGPARAINAYDIDSVHAARLLIEREVAADAARRIDDATLATLEGLLAVQKEAFNDPVGFLICDREFHVTIYRASGNALLADFAADLYSYMMEYRRLAVARPEAIATSYADHAAIVAALRAHDPDAAVAAFAVHTDRIYQTTQTVMGFEKK
ncbi:FadR/GntR family transcriptional regulator [Chelatococcus asaccharovorans]|uniref:FadR/GntR family transcriptional regulator n=1 Tax=Chelatococcus asaccharovorans TaxID=28210 RepID=UPI00224C6707|nr:FadR/GntR family transcriptional regulator [Chelatococcus asaccharovorans]CAH1651126.1 GntR family transcriptional regulator [Chelatococcus asaccharovorans]CAH1686665.1 GntR family transcriptional regulator [Chelatococcus asaccharovorans]